MNNHGKIIIICGPSGVGKGTIIKLLLNDKNLPINIIKTNTTRPLSDRDLILNNRRSISKDQFDNLLKNHEFLETNFYNGHYYGTLKKDIENIIAKNQIGILEQDIDHALFTKRNYPDNTAIIFIYANLENIKNRLIKRGENTEKEIQMRIAIGKKELTKKHLADYAVENLENHPELAVNKIKNIIIKEEK